MEKLYPAVELTVKERLKKEIAMSPFTSVTTDIWSSLQGSAYQGMTLRSVAIGDGSMLVTEKPLGIMPVPGIHDAAAVTAAVSAQLDEWGIQHAKVQGESEILQVSLLLLLI